MPLFAQEILYWQSIAGVSAAETALIGFSQGAIMALQASSMSTMLASRIVSHSGRYAQLPTAVNPKVTLHLVHGKSDNVIPYRHCIEAAQRLQNLGADFTADVLPFLEHQTSEESIALLVSNLKHHLPRHLWTSALETGVPKLAKSNSR
jgi:phospholipase/carboxylesterase